MQKIIFGLACVFYVGLTGAQKKSDWMDRTDGCATVISYDNFELNHVSDAVVAENTVVPRYFRGIWFESSPTELIEQSRYIRGSRLVVPPNETLATVDRNLRRGEVPTFSGAQSFGISVCYKLTGWHAAFWPAVWMLPIEHNQAREAIWPDDPPNFERWVEFDIDEGGFGPGFTGTAHNWNGDWPKIQAKHNLNNIRSEYLDRTKDNCFSLFYDKNKLSIDWYLNGHHSHGTGDYFLHPVARRHNYFLIFSNQYHKSTTHNYEMLVESIVGFKCP